jgi:potassium-transporting ATPase KdpC subunit
MLKEFTKQLIPSLRMLVVLTVLTGVIYPVVITLAASAVFPYQAGGSLQTQNGQVIGSALIGQNFTSDTYFWSRPSAISYSPLPSSGSNLGPTSAVLKQQMDDRAAAIRAANKLPDDAGIPTDLLFASGSGLDPQISPDAARLQINRVATARGFTDEQRDELISLVESFVESPQLGMLGQPRVNVLMLNIALDDLE